MLVDYIFHYNSMIWSVIPYLMFLNSTFEVAIKSIH